jgi:hypothetical protein
MTTAAAKRPLPRNLHRLLTIFTLLEPTYSRAHWRTCPATGLSVGETVACKAICSQRCRHRQKTQVTAH